MAANLDPSRRRHFARQGHGEDWIDAEVLSDTSHSVRNALLETSDLNGFTSTAADVGVDLCHDLFEHGLVLEQVRK